MSAPKREREMTKRDWHALYLVMRLQEQIVLYGADVLDDFIDGANEARAPHRVSPMTDPGIFALATTPRTE